MSSAPASWGPWRLDAEHQHLYSDKNSAVGYEYPIDLSTCRTSAGVLDWIIQIHEKGWAPSPAGNAEIVAGRIAAFNDVLDPQGNLCSGGSSKTMSKEKLDQLIGRRIHL